jgi:uncharacterized protein YciI
LEFFRFGNSHLNVVSIFPNFNSELTIMKKYLFALALVAAFSTVFSQTHIIVFLNKRSDKSELPKEETDKIMDGHMANIKRLAAEGKLLAAGPFDGGGGLFIFKSNSTAEVSEWIQTDPGVKAQRWRVEVLPFYIRSGKIGLVSEPYQMVSYQFIRYTPNIGKSNIKELPELFKKHDDFLSEIKKKSELMADGVFGDTEGGILILKTELPLSDFEPDPAVQQGLLHIDIKKLYIAKGAFGEK